MILLWPWLIAPSGKDPATHTAASSVSHVIRAFGTVMDARSKPLRYLGHGAANFAKAKNGKNTTKTSKIALPSPKKALTPPRNKLSRPNCKCYLKMHATMLQMQRVLRNLKKYHCPFWRLDMLAVKKLVTTNWTRTQNNRGKNIYC